MELITNRTQVGFETRGSRLDRFCGSIHLAICLRRYLHGLPVTERADFECA
jgi:hypothetical protein